MNRDKLTHLLEALKAAIGELQPELEKPVDQFVLHVYRARRAYDRETGRKGSKRAEQEAFQSYRRAVELGFRGDGQAWLAVLKAHSSEGPSTHSGTHPS